MGFVFKSKVDYNIVGNSEFTVDCISAYFKAAYFLQDSKLLNDQNRNEKSMVFHQAVLHGLCFSSDLNQFLSKLMMMVNSLYIVICVTVQVSYYYMEKSLDYDYIFKYILIGDASVGKSALLNMFINQTFVSESNPTMGVEFATKKLVVDGQIIKVQIWDTAGQESFRTITRAYYKNAIGVILVYDLNNADSLKSIDLWLKQIHDNSKEIAETIIVGNKSDLCQPPSSSPKKDFPFIATSAKTGHNIKKIFTILTQTILQNIKSGKIDVESVSGIKKGNVDPEQRIKLGKEINEQRGDKKTCCR